MTILKRTHPFSFETLTLTVLYMAAAVNNRKRPGTKLKNAQDIDRELELDPPENVIDSNISGLAKLNLTSDSSDLSDLQAEIERIEKIDNEKKWKNQLNIIVLSFIVVATAIYATVSQSMLMSANHYYFPFPIFSAGLTVVVQLIGAALVIGYFGRLGMLGREFMSRDGWKAMYQAILPCSLVTAAELGVTFLSLQYVTASLYTMVKSSGIIFILIGAFLTGRERVNVFLLGVILLTGIGIVFAAWEPKSTVGLEIFGFSLVLLSTILNSAKWVLTELLLNENGSFKSILEKLNAPRKKHSKPLNLTPFLSVFLLTPITLSLLIIGSVIFEGFPLQIVSFLADESVGYATITMGGLLVASVLVFIMRVADFRLVQLVSLVTFSFLGIIKEIIMIAISVIFLGEVLFPINIAGLIITIIGVSLYNYYRILESKREEAIKKGNFEIELQSRHRTSQILPVSVK